MRRRIGDYLKTLVGGAHPTEMPEYRRYFVAGGTYFFTMVTYCRRPLFAERRNVQRLRDAIGEVKRDQPFDIQAAVVLPDHLHFVWALPPGDDRYSKRIGRIKVLFTRSCHDAQGPPQDLSPSRRKHRESGVWQRRFWEHVIRDEREFERCLDYIHYNPVKHRLATCPHLWEASSFFAWVQRGLYEPHWGCCCEGRDPGRLAFADIEKCVGE